jgi:hypothetical protein
MYMKTTKSSVISQLKTYIISKAPAEWDLSESIRQMTPNQFSGPVYPLNVFLIYHFPQCGARFSYCDIVAGLDSEGGLEGFVYGLEPVYSDEVVPEGHLFLAFGRFPPGWGYWGLA